MIGSLDGMHKLICTISSAIQISSINHNRFRFNLGKPRLHHLMCIQRLYQIVRFSVTDIIVLNGLVTVLAGSVILINKSNKSFLNLWPEIT